MKKVILGALMFVILLGSGFQHGRAQEKNVRFGLNAGFVGVSVDGEGAGLLTIGGALDLRFGNNLLISPEIDIWTNNFSDTVLVIPGAILNFQTGVFFIGAGVARPIHLTADTEFGVWPKLNLGIRGKHLRFTLYIAAADNDGFVGASIGFIF